LQLVDDKKVRVFTLKKGINDTILYDEDAVVKRFGFKPEFLPDYKGLRGDPSDNIIGIKGIGEKTAQILISKFGTIEEIYQKIKKDEESFKKAGISPRMIELLKENEEEALFSKTLATIRTDAPVDFKLSEKTFWKNIDPQKIEEVFSQFEFKSLLARLKGFLGNGNPDDHSLRHSHSVLEGQDILGRSEDSSENNHPNVPTIDPQKLQETGIALWLINSDLVNPDLEDILVFAKTKDFSEARDFIFKKLAEQKLDKVYAEIEKPIIPAIKKMEEHGILIDKKYFEQLSAEYHTELDIRAQKIYQIAGTEFNINSPKQLGEVLFEKMGIKSKKRKTAGGSLSTRFSVLEELGEDNPIIQEILAYRELAKLLSTYIDVIPQMTGADNRLHAKFLQNGTTTGRFSSQEPNLQNLPIKSELGKKIRYGFVAAPGHQLAAFDYSQVELRIMAMLSGDKKMTEVFREQKDIHTGVASFVFGVPADKVDSEMRRQAKIINFGIIYGMGVTALQKNLGGERAEAQKFYDNYFRQFSGVRDYLDEIKIFAAEHSYTETLFDRRRYFPNIKSRIPFLRSMAERTATNAPIQGTAADIIKLAIRFAEEDLQKANLSDKAHLVLQIHDELVFEIKEDVLSETAEIIKKAMEGVLLRSYLHYKTEIPLNVHFGSGLNLGEVK